MLCKIRCRLKYACLLDRNRLHISVMVQLGKNGGHPVIPQAAGVVGRWDKPAAERIHACHRRNFSGIAEIVSIFAACKGRTGSGFHRNNSGVRLSGQLIAHKRSNQPAKVGASASAPNDNIRVFTKNLHCCLRFQANDRLMQQHLIEH